MRLLVIDRARDLAEMLTSPAQNGEGRSILLCRLKRS